MTTQKTGILRLGDRVEFDGKDYVFAALNGGVAELRTGPGTPLCVLMTALLTDTSFKLIGIDGIRRRGLGESKIFEALPAPVKDRAHWLENHIIEVLDGIPAEAEPGTRPRREYDVTPRSLRQRLLAKETELQETGNPLSFSTLKRLTRAYEPRASSASSTNVSSGAHRPPMRSSSCCSTTRISPLDPSTASGGMWKSMSEPSTLQLAKAAETFVEVLGNAEFSGADAVSMLAEQISLPELRAAVDVVTELVNPAGSEGDTAAEMMRRFTTVRSFLPALASAAPFGATAGGTPTLAALATLPDVLDGRKTDPGHVDLSEFSHVSEASARMNQPGVSVAAILVAEACNVGLTPVVKDGHPALTRGRLSHVDQNYVRADTLRAANSRLVQAQSSLGLAQRWGAGLLASVDGMRFVVPVATVNAGANPRYFGQGRGLTWLNYLNDQVAGLGAVVVPGDGPRFPTHTGLASRS